MTIWLAAGGNKTQGILCVLGAVSVFSLQDALIKGLSDRYALHEVILARASIAGLVLVLMARLEGSRQVLRTDRPGLNIVRGLFLVITNMCFFLSVAAMPLADAVALFFVAPLFITILSIPILGERVGVHRWAAVLVGMAGVVIMLRPGHGEIKLASLLPVAAALCYACTQMVTRRIGIADKASTMALYIQLVFIVASLLFGLFAGDGRYSGSGDPSLEFLFRPWVVPSRGDALLVVGIGLLSAVGSFLMTQAYRVAETTVVAPFEYAALPFAMMWGLLFWGDWPDGTAFVGIALILIAGLYVFYRETVRRQAIC